MNAEQFSDADLTRIYKEANGELDGKPKPLFTQNIFNAMRAMSRLQVPDMTQAAILRFEGKHEFLSNFYPVPIHKYGITFPTLEHAYVASKVVSRATRETIAVLSTPGRAKRFIREKDITTPDWHRFKVEVMLDLLIQKFSDPTLESMLLATGDRILVEGNFHGDRFWGQCDGVGENVLGQLLMVVRSLLRANLGFQNVQ